jgi:hypothetical protein
MYIAADAEVTMPCLPHRSPLHLIKLSVHVHLDELKVLLHLSQEETTISRRWVLDTAATNHMTDSRAVFAELNNRFHRHCKIWRRVGGRHQGQGHCPLRVQVRRAPLS